MQFFYLVNGWAGRNELADATLRFFYVSAVPLLATALVAALLLVPRAPEASSRLRIALAALIALGLCSLTLPAINAFALNCLQTPILSPRPFVTHFVNAIVVEPNDNSFPCPEVMLAAAMATIGCAIWPLAGGIAWGLVLALGLTRFYCGTNYPIDVYVGEILGAAWAGFSLALCRVSLRFPFRNGQRLIWRARHQAIFSGTAVALVTLLILTSLVRNPRYADRLKELVSGPHATAAASPESLPVSSGTEDVHEPQEGEGVTAAPGGLGETGTASTNLESQDTEETSWIEPSSPLDPQRRHGRQPEAEAILKNALQRLHLPHRIHNVEVAQVHVGNSSYRCALVRFQVSRQGPQERQAVVETAAHIVKTCFHADGQLKNVDVVGAVFNANGKTGIERSMITLTEIPVFTASVLRRNLRIINGPQWVNAPNVDGGSWLRARSLLYIDPKILPPISAQEPKPTPTKPPAPAVPVATPTAVPPIQPPAPVATAPVATPKPTRAAVKALPIVPHHTTPKRTVAPKAPLKPARPAVRKPVVRKPRAARQPAPSRPRVRPLRKRVPEEARPLRRSYRARPRTRRYRHVYRHYRHYRYR